MNQPMKYYPVYLDIRGRTCLVVGGGGVGTRKVEKLLESGAKVRVVSPEVSPKLTELADQGRIDLQTRAYRGEDLQGAFLVIGATDDEDLNRRINTDAERLDKLCNIADRPEVCNFILPAIIRQGDLAIAISTSGNSPAFAKKLRRQLQKQFGPEYGTFLELMGAIRKRLLAEAHEPEAHKPLFEQILAAGLIELIAEEKYAEVSQRLEEILGTGYTWPELMPAGSETA
jgi:precorrin-2 dehydrogenase